jgi:hypothetical protein
MHLYSTVLATCSLGLSLLVTSTPSAGQTPTSDPTAASPETTTQGEPARTDTFPDSGSSDTTPDSVQPPGQTDSASALDSTGLAPGSARRDTAANKTKADTTAAFSAPRDSILDVACSGPGGSTRVARDLLVVVFAPESGHRERTAVAKSVEGKLLGPVSSGELGGYYLRVPTGGNEYRLRTAADQLIQLAEVKQVGSRSCPPLPSPGKAPPAQPELK